ncbi:uncharacterized protein AB675_3366 [Cyphellophora attinorum]|uniref:Ubiquitin-like domain-containing protein n=1 Tax=Cyphellophora attinorum TaxID=1664694 RepID=A0A0N1NZ51_9EURO|nr:uncharacterized protein AB675_3366 [Phialophora attinorum]KPI39680.1 hypothetical protein AB675_3366 [Phialophora attinorum]
MSASKPSLFKRPAWAAAPNATAASAGKLSVFGQLNVAEDIVAEDRRKREEREAKQRAKAEKLSAKSIADDEQPAPKKRRISKDRESSPVDSETSSTHAGSSPFKASTPEPVETKRSLRSTPKKNQVLLEGIEPESRKKPERKTTVISLDESDDDGSGDLISPAPTPRQKPSAGPSTSTRASKPEPAPPPEDEEDDPFLRELQRKARESTRQQQNARRSQPPIETPGAATDEHGSPSQASPDTSQLIDTTQPTQPTTREANVAIWIKTHIPNTKDLVVNRRASQILQQVREFWINKHKLEPALASQVFFAWRGTRLYNSSTAQSLINILKREAGIPLHSDEDPSEGKLHVDAVTQDILDQQARAKAQLAAAVEAAQNGAAEEDDDAANADDAGEGPPEPPKKESLLLILRCKGVEELKLSVRPSTRVSKIMSAFQSQRKIDKSKKCWLVFDGDRLDEDEAAGGVGFDDACVVEVHPR